MCTIQRTTPVSLISGYVGSSIIVSIFKKCPSVSCRRPTHSTWHTPRHAHPTRRTLAHRQRHSQSLALLRTPAKTSPRNRIHPHHRCPPLPASVNGSVKREVVFYPAKISNVSPRACRSLIRRMPKLDLKKRACIEEVMTHSWVAESGHESSLLTPIGY